MNQKELNEIRRRWKFDHNSVSRIYGCYVNNNKDIISTFDTSLGLMGQEETGMYLSLIKKTLSGTMGKNLMDIEFSTHQVADSEEHRLLMDLKKSSCSDDRARQDLFGRIISSIVMEECNYLILLASDTYDVPLRGSDEQNQAEGGTEVYQYFLCCVCPVKPAALALRYNNENGEFHSTSTGQVAANPALGFLFPCFDGRQSNIYNALYYAHDPKEIHQEVINAVFRTDSPMSAPAQQEAFTSAISESLEKDCSFDVVQSVHEQLRSCIELHKESKIPENLTVSINDVGGMLRESGLEEEKVEAFRSECRKQFGDTAELNPNVIMDTKKFKVETPEVKISVAPENSYLIETRIINGRKFILIPADNGVEVNGISVCIENADDKK